MKVISLYNHKGGVSKTTTTFNLSYYLALNGKKVLLIDADPQCNLTELCLSRIISELDDKAADSDVIDELPGTSILDALIPRIEGSVPEVDIDQIIPVPLIDNLELVRGSVDLTSIEDELSEAHSQRFASRTNLMRTYVAIGDMLTRLGEKNKYDYIFIDLGPSAGALTRAFFLSCDAFFVPIAPDRFNVQAIKTLSSILNRWLEEHAQIYNTYSSYALPVKHGKPQFLGAISQFFKMYKGKPKKGFDVWMKRIPEQINECLLPILTKSSTEERPLCPVTRETYIAAQIPDFGSLAPLMQEVGKPVFSITKADTALITDSGAEWNGATWDDATARMDNYRRCFKQLAERLEVAI
ncbi:cellulose biosynthesis protein BcsQ [Aeromonas sp. BIGb0405]|uniref:ParA family protein n=1 Tax=Aeromonas sp. BIGb0405 TaxID=2940592 RepID=UPI002169E795|nr:AAA family ATPase [Aeromonas sp. BIGb0405]MCS3454285.1 cellulose biosynthesis protein BcsQ [Aeromonas sp. BIGb0405]